MKHSTAGSLKRLFVDTWGWLALEDSADPAHAAVLNQRRGDVAAGVLWITTEYVLDETITLLFRRLPFREAERFCAGVFRTRDAGLLDIQAVTPERFAAAWRLRLLYRDKPSISFTDLTSFVVMKELGTTRVLTADAHFHQVQRGFELVPGNVAG